MEIFVEEHQLQTITSLIENQHHDCGNIFLHIAYRRCGDGKENDFDKVNAASAL
jgi:hypothetical protein